MTNKEKEDIVESLDFRFECIFMQGTNPIAERASYNGMTKMLELCGYDWQRDENGKHRIFKK